MRNDAEGLACAAQHVFVSLQWSKDGKCVFLKLYQDVAFQLMMSYVQTSLAFVQSSLSCACKLATRQMQNMQQLQDKSICGESHQPR